MQFSTKHFLNDRFGSPDGVLALLRKHGLESPNKEAVIKWFYRGNIPGEWWPRLILVLQAEDRLTDFNVYAEGKSDDVFA